MNDNLRTIKIKVFNSEPIPLGDFEDPPTERLNQPWDIPSDIPARPCIECGKMHNAVVADKVKETHTPLGKCYDCFWKNAFVYKPIKEQIEFAKHMRNFEYD